MRYDDALPATCALLRTGAYGHSPAAARAAESARV